jgi:hypothetical protein
MLLERPPDTVVVANMLNKQSMAADKGRSFSFGDGLRLATSHRTKTACYKILYSTSSLEGGKWVRKPERKIALGRPR